MSLKTFNYSIILIDLQPVFLLISHNKVCKSLLRARLWWNSFQIAAEKPLCNHVKMIDVFPVKHRAGFKWVHVIILFADVKSSLILSQTPYLAASNCF